MVKKIFIISIIFLFAAILIFADKDKSAEKTHLQFASWGSDSELQILKPILSDFEQKNPDIKIDFMHIPQNYFQKIHLLFASNTAPDVIFINNQYLSVYANAKVLEDLSGKDFEYDKFYQKAINSMKWQDKIYAVPRDISDLVIFYNKDLFKKYGVKYPNDNWTFDDFLKTAQKLTKRPDLFGISFEENPIYYFPYILSDGYSGNLNYDNIKNTSGLKFYADLRNKYHVAPMREESASATMAQMFLQGKLAMHMSGRWLVPIYRRDAKFDWDIAPMPRGKAGSIVTIDSSGWAISKSSKHKQEAIRLIKYLSSKESIDKFSKEGLIVPARIDSANSANFLDGKKPKNAKVFLSIIENGVPTPVTVDFREVLDELKTKTENLFVKNE